MPGLQQYLNNVVLATISESTTDLTITSVSVYNVPTTMAKIGDNLLIISKQSGRQYQITLSSDLNEKTNTCSFLSTTFDTTIPEGSIIIHKKATTFDRTNFNIEYINFSSQAAASQYWITFSSSGISNHTWNTTTTDTGVTVDSSQITSISTAIQSVGIVVPYACTLIGVRATIYRVGNFQTAVGLFCGTPKYNDNATEDFTLRAYAAADNSAGPDSNYSQRPVKAEDLNRSHALSAGDIILPAFNSVTNDGGNARISYTIVLKTQNLL